LFTGVTCSTIAHRYVRQLRCRRVRAYGVPSKEVKRHQLREKFGPATHEPVAVGTCVSSHAPRTEQYVRLSRIRLPPRVQTRQLLAACVPVPVTLVRRCVRCVLSWSAFPLVSALGFTGSAAVAPIADCSTAGVPLCSSASQLLWQGQTSRARASSATAPHLPDAGRQRQRRAGQTRDLPASDAIPLHVMWP
jgi:hypothetical protein